MSIVRILIQMPSNLNILSKAQKNQPIEFFWNSLLSMQDREEAALCLLHAVLQEKKNQLESGVNVDGSWQSSVAWIGGMPDTDHEIRTEIASCVLRAMNNPSLVRLREAILELSNILVCHSLNRRDQLLITVDSIKQQDKGVLVIRLGRKVDYAKDLTLPVYGKTDLALLKASEMLHNGGSQKIFGQGAIGYTSKVAALLKTAKERVKHQPYSQVSILARNEDRDKALSLAHALSTLWNVPCFERGEMDPIMNEYCYHAAKATCE